jgi:uncharacterized protein (TIGR03083 family)
MPDSNVIPSLDPDLYRSAFRRERNALAQAAESGLRTLVPSCPEWTVATLLAHLGGAYAYVAKTISAGTGEDSVQDLEDLGLPPDIEEWFREDSALERMPSTVLPWFRAAGDELQDVFARFGTDAPAWTWWPPDGTAGFWLRRMANETAIHRWDVQSAVGRAEPIEGDLARDGIDEMFDIYIPRWCRPKSTLGGSGETFRFQRADGEAVWTVLFEGEGMSVYRDGRPGDVSLRGSASDLILFLWQRILPDRLEVEGDVNLLGHYFDFVPPD